MAETRAQEDGDATVDVEGLTPGLLEEVLSNNETSALRVPIMIFARLLASVAERASQLHDAELDQLMLRLAMYEIADPASPSYDAKKVSKLLKEA